ncbi:transposase [Streptomyces atratus]|uniref:transposase n=1 Tax=Streptomyces atratus TaxID=1893 RepID=UPI0036BDCB19
MIRSRSAWVCDSAVQVLSVCCCAGARPALVLVCWGCRHGWRGCGAGGRVLFGCAVAGADEQADERDEDFGGDVDRFPDGRPLLDPDTASAAELAALYAERWEIETTLDEIKTHLGGPRLVLRSQHPAGAEQEIFAFLLVHHAVRDLMHEAARQEGHDPDRIPFTRAVRVVRRQVTAQAGFSPLPTHAGPRTDSA